MNTDKSASLVEGDLSEKVIGIFFSVYNELGSGFLESVYESALALALHDAHVRAVRQAPVNVVFRGHIVGEFRVDILVEDRLVIEIKAGSGLVPAHEAQLINYLRATGVRVGLLLNFGPQPEFRRRVF